MNYISTMYIVFEYIVIIFHTWVIFPQQIWLGCKKCQEVPLSNLKYHTYSFITYPVIEKDVTWEIQYIEASFNIITKWTVFT